MEGGRVREGEREREIKTRNNRTRAGQQKLYKWRPNTMLRKMVTTNKQKHCTKIKTNFISHIQ